MSRSRAVTPDTSKPPLRLRVPASLAVALLGTSVSFATAFGGCEEVPPDPVDAGEITRLFDGGVDGGDGRDGSDDPDTLPDAYAPPADAYAPPDTPDH